MITGLKNLKRHYFESHGLVPIEKRPSMTDGVFGLSKNQLRELSCDNEGDAIIFEADKQRYIRKNGRLFCRQVPN